MANAATALPMALYRPVLFLALVAVFSFYAAFSGYRVLKLKELARGGSAIFANDRDSAGHALRGRFPQAARAAAAR